jgi:uncharacterized membrane protein YdjX (TVP38/TMEM64 family)
MHFLTDWLSSSEQFFQHLGWVGMLVFALVMVAAGMVLVPLSVFAITAGIIFGPVRGFIIVQAATTLSAAINFLVSRYIARQPIRRRVERNPKFRAIDSAIGREGWKIVVLLRFVPLPFGFMNYALGLTAISFLPYVAATSVGVIINNAVFVYLGTTAHAGLAAATGAHHPIESVLMVVGLAAGFAAMVYVTKVARAAVARAGVEPT